MAESQIEVLAAWIIANNKMADKPQPTRSTHIDGEI